MKQKIIVVDLDGTISDCRHRLHYIEGGKKDFNKFYEGILDDDVYWIRWYLIKFIAWVTRSKIVFSTGRSLSTLAKTSGWLWNNLCEVVINGETWKYDYPVHGAKLIYMRSEKDLYKDKALLKMGHVNNMSEKYGDVWLFIDDSDKVCGLMSRLGIKVWNVTRRKYKNSYAEV